MTTVPPNAVSPPAPAGNSTTDQWEAAWRRTAIGTSAHDPNLGFHRDHAEKLAHEERQAAAISGLVRIEEAKAAQAAIRAGAPVPNLDPMFEYRRPRDVLRRTVPQPFHWDDVPRSIGEFAWYYSKATGFDLSGVIVACVTAAASVIDDGYKLVVREGSGWSVSARQWAFLCGGPSAGKSPCIRAATDHIKHMHGVLYERWLMADAGLRREERDPVPAIYTSDSTIPALSVALQANPRGLLMLTEEFTSLVGAIDAADRGEAAKNRGDWLQLRDGGPHQINRVERGAIFIPN